MSILTTVATVTAATFALAYGAGQFVTKSLSTEITIDAPIEAVWAEFSDTNAYASWNPFMTQLDGALEQGAQLSVTVQPAGKSPMGFTPRVLIAEPGEELRWVGRLFVPGILTGNITFNSKSRPMAQPCSATANIFAVCWPSRSSP